MSLLEKAIRENSPLLIEKQLKSGQTLHDKHLFLAIEGQNEALKLLLNRGLNPDVIDRKRQNLLFYITDPDLFKFVLSHMKNIDRPNIEGDTIMHQLIRNLFEHKNIQLIDHCLSRKPNLALRNKKVQTVLLSIPIPRADKAYNKENLEFMFSPSYFAVIDKLLASGSSISETDDDGNTLLHHMIQAMKVDKDLQATVEAMVKRGAPINQRNKLGVNILAQLLIKIETERSASIGSSYDDTPDAADTEADIFPENAAEEEFP